jgi:hypothetical protein
MKGFIISMIMVLAVMSSAMAQLEIGLFGGYGFPAGGVDFMPGYEAKITGSGTISYDSYKDEYLSMGNGLKAGINACYNFTDNIGVLAIVNVSVLEGKTITQKYTDLTVTPNPVQTEIWKIKSTSTVPSVNLGLRLKAAMGPFEPYVYLAPGLSFSEEIELREKIDSENIPGDTSWHGFPPSNPGVSAEESMLFGPGFSLAGGIGTKIKIIDKFGVNIEFAPEYSFAKMTELRTNGITVIYKQNETNLPADTADKVYAHGGPAMSFSSLGVKVGVYYSF